MSGMGLLPPTHPTERLESVRKSIGSSHLPKAIQSILRNRFSGAKLKTKIIVTSVGLLVLAIWTLAHDVTVMVHNDVESAIAVQQTILVEHIADSLELEAKTRVETLSDVASMITPKMMGDTERLRSAIAQYKPLGRLFDLGLLVLSKGGVALVDYPAVEGRAGSDFSDEDYFRMVMATDNVAISQPRLGRFTKTSVVHFAIPIRGSAQEIIGVLVGSNSLSDSNLFSETILHHASAGEEFHILSASDGIYLASTMPARVLKSVPKPGVDHVIDRYLEGYEGEGVSMDSEGVITLSFSRRVPTTGWLVIGTIPTKNAYASIKVMEQDIYKDAAIWSIVIAITLWVSIYRLLSRSGSSVVKSRNQ